MHGADQVGLLTGDNSVNGDAPIVVMTTEVLRNMIYAASPALDGLRYVVLDEVHYLQDRYRGPVWEEVIVHLPAEVTLVCLSATVSNAEEVAAWIETVRGSTAAIIEEHRPVTLEHRYLVGERGTDALHLLPTFVAAPGRRAAPQPRGGPPRRPQRTRPADGGAGRARGLRTPEPGRDRRAPRRRVDAARDRVRLQPRRVATRRSSSAWPPGCASPSRRSAPQIRAIADAKTAGLADDDLDVLALRPVARRVSRRASPPTTRAWCRR